MNLKLQNFIHELKLLPFPKIYITKAEASRISTTELVNKIFTFCELYSGITFYPYQEQYSKRIIRSALENDGAEITALFARQGGKSEVVAVTVGGMMIILPKLANMPMFADDIRLQLFKDGFWVGIFAPSMRQSQITYNRMRARLQSKSAKVILNDPDFRLQFSCSNGQTVALTNGSFATAISASEGSNIEGESLKFIICEEAQDISNYKVRKCLSETTEIWLPSGGKTTIKEVVDNKLAVITLGGEKTPTQFYNNGVQQVFEITLANGRKISSTENHQFFVRRRVGNRVPKWDVVSNLKVGDTIATPKDLPYFGEAYTYTKGLITGLILGDGCMSTESPVFCCLPQIRGYLDEALQDFDVHYNEYKFNVNSGLSEGKIVKNTRYDGRENELVSFFKELQIWGSKGENKTITSKMFEGSREFLEGLVCGLIESDGCVSNSEISFTNISESMVRTLQDILLKFSIPSRVSCRDNNGSYGINPKKLWTCSIKSVIGIENFYSAIRLKSKQSKLDTLRENKKLKNTRKVIQDKRRGKRSNNVFFERIVSIEYIGEVPTYCLEVEGRNFIANGIVSSNSIMPMGAAYNASITKIGTSTTFKGDFYEAIQRNKRDYEKSKIPIKNHFEYDCDVVMKYNEKYRKYIEKQKIILGENSDEYRMSYKLEWILQRGMFVDLDILEKENGEENLGRVFNDMQKVHVVGIDVAGKNDATVITVGEVDWNNPVICESHVNEEGVEETFTAYETLIKDWLEIMGDDYEEQYYQILDYLSNFLIKRLVIDATKESSMAHRLRANLPYEVIPFIFTSKSKSDMYKHLDVEIKARRARFPKDETTIKTREYKRFTQQLADLQKGYSGPYLVVSHPPERGAQDDFPDSWGLMVWGAKEAGDSMGTETTSKKAFMKEGTNKSFYKGRNKLTARRR